MFNPEYTDLITLKSRAYNLRWAETPEGVIPLTAADPDFPCAPEISEAISQYTSKRYFNYAPPEGLPLFRESMSEFMFRKRSVSISPEKILAVDSAAFGIYLICQSFLQKGDEALIFDPVDFLFRYSVEAAGAKAVSYAIAAGVVDETFSEMELLITPSTKMICLCNPLNPTGKVFTKEELEKLLALAEKYNLLILSDEIWSDIVFHPHTFTSIASLNASAKNRTITVTGFSKSYGLAGLRIGAVMAENPEIYERIVETSRHRSTVHGANVIGQVAAATAMNACENWLSGFIEHLHHMRSFCVESFNQIPQFSCIAPEGCYVAFADIRNTGMTSSEMHAHLLTHAKVAVVPGLAKWFGPGAEGYIRISFATSSAILQEAFERMKSSLT